MRRYLPALGLAILMVTACSSSQSLAPGTRSVVSAPVRDRSYQARRRGVPGGRQRASAGVGHGLRLDDGGLGSPAGSRARPAQPGGDVRQLRRRPYPGTAPAVFRRRDGRPDQRAHQRPRPGQAGRTGLVDGRHDRPGPGGPAPRPGAPPGAVRHLPRDRDGRRPRRRQLQAGSDFPANQASASTHSRQRSRNTRPPPRRRPARKGLRGSPYPSGGTAATRPGARSQGSQCPRLSPTAPATSSTRSPMTTPSPASSPAPRLVLYPDAGHGFLFQDWTRFAALVDSFLTGNPSP